MAHGAELYKVASTLFLGIGIAVVLQGRLVPEKPDFPIPTNAHGTWIRVDAAACAAMLVIIGAGELLAVRSSISGTASANTRHVTIILLVVTATYVVCQTVLRRALAVAWSYPQEADAGTSEPTYNGEAMRAFGIAVVAGTLLGAGVFLAVLLNQVQLLLVSLLGPVGRYLMDRHIHT